MTEPSMSSCSETCELDNSDPSTSASEMPSASSSTAAASSIIFAHSMSLFLYNLSIFSYLSSSSSSSRPVIAMKSPSSSSTSLYEAGRGFLSTSMGTNSEYSMSFSSPG
ncbi:hypothetical protein FR483_n728R [Paramecium bursaria Chlorella virus FR483]|uniref:Uncharacterized protein n728R n=1 Tax=Paramecium bursaria Chlorella virus FR483 TaxID=399781 RepID=A7J882_PBCVF|nr:hypothetical protein FR483_n728R [Paramecium bursaria Chlorella virus FR483]ABT16013.1 hypothetical protein FR483_n728R [Paramecium bursaria Chlorella virus FR483]